MSISNFINTGSISGHKSAIVSQAHISNFINMGILEGRESSLDTGWYNAAIEGYYNRSGIFLAEHTTIGNFINTGTIKGRTGVTALGTVKNFVNTRRKGLV